MGAPEIRTLLLVVLTFSLHISILHYPSMLKHSLLFILTSALSVFGSATKRSPAPYHRSQVANLVEDQYLVALHDGHTIDDHFKAIGLDLSQNASLFYRLDALNAYQARLDPRIVHQLVRLDPGVEFVDHDSYMGDFDEVETGEPFLPEADISTSTTGLVRTWVASIKPAWYWNHMISAGEKLPTPVPKKSSYVRNSCQEY